MFNTIRITSMVLIIKSTTATEKEPPMLIEIEERIAPWSQTKWLVLSSFCFLIPSVYGFLHELYFHSALLVATSLVSINYWRNATDSWRRSFDMFFSKISFAVFVISGVWYVNMAHYLLTGYIGLFLICYFYCVSSIFYELNKNDWYKYYAMFHVIIAYEQWIVLDSIYQYHHGTCENPFCWNTEV